MRCAICQHRRKGHACLRENLTLRHGLLWCAEFTRDEDEWERRYGKGKVDNVSDDKDGREVRS